MEPLISLEDKNSGSIGGYGGLINATYYDVIKHKYKIMGFIVFCLGLALTYLYITPLTYTAEAQILLEAPSSAVEQRDDKTSNYTSLLDNPRAESQVQVLRSERLLRYVFDLLHLDKTSELLKNPETLLMTVKKYLISAPSNSDFADRQEPSNDAFSKFAAGVSSRRVGQSYVVEISYSTSNPMSAAQITNSIAMAYIRQQIESRYAMAQNGTEYLQGRIRTLELQLEEAKKAILNGTIPDRIFPDADARVIGAALSPKSATYPKKGLVIFFSIVLSAFFSLVFIAVKNNFSRSQ